MELLRITGSRPHQRCRGHGHLADAAALALDCGVQRAHAGHRTVACRGCGRRGHVQHQPGSPLAGFLSVGGLRRPSSPPQISAPGLDAVADVRGEPLRRRLQLIGGHR